MKVEEENITDAKLEAMMDSMIIKEPKNLKCRNNNPVLRMCINSNCDKFSLICGNAECPTCNEDDHEECPLIKIKNVVNLINKNVNNRKDSILRISEIDNFFFNRLRQTNFQMIKECPLGGLQDKQRKVMQDIFEKKNSRTLKGMETNQFYNRIKILSQINPSGKYLSSLFTTYEKTVETFIKETNSLKKKIIDSWSSENNIEQKVVPPKAKVLNPIKMDSVILRKCFAHQNQEVEFLTDILNNPIKIDLLFRASEYNFSIRIFKEKCNDIEDTLLLVHSKKKKTFGGFTHYPWKITMDQDLEVQDTQRRSFLFSLDKKEKYEQTSDYSIVRSNKYGPIFGKKNSYDLRIGDRTKLFSQSNFPLNYNRSEGEKIKKCWESSIMFSGTGQDLMNLFYGNIFEIVEYEVFKVTYRQ